MYVQTRRERAKVFKRRKHNDAGFLARTSERFDTLYAEGGLLCTIGMCVSTVGRKDD